NKRRVFVCGGRTGLNAPTLVNGNINEYCTGPHMLEHVTGHEPRCLGARDEDCTHYEINFGQQLTNSIFIRHQGPDIARHHIVEVPEACQVAIDHDDVSAHASGNLCTVRSDNA